MSLRVNRKDIVDYCILWLMMLHVMIIRWLSLTGRFNLVLLALFLYWILKDTVKFVKNRGIIWLGLILAYAVYNYMTHGGEAYIFVNNVFEYLTPVMELIYIVYLMNYKKDLLIRFFHMLFWPLFIYNLFNMMFIFLQLNGQYWLAGLTDNVNDYAVDLISGLLGFNGVPELTFFSVFMIFYNYFYMQNYAGRYKVFLSGYNLLLTVFYLVLSAFNDNKGFYIILVMYILVYISIINESKSFQKNFFTRIKNFMKWAIPLLVVMVLTFFVMYHVSFFKSYIDRLLHELSAGITYMSAYQGSSERFGMIAYILSQPESRLTGFGLGQYKWTTPNTFGFIHYGQSDVGTFMCLGGVVFVALLGALVYDSFSRVFNKSIIPLILLIMYIVLAVYTQVFTVTSLMVSSLFFLVVCWMEGDFRIQGKVNRRNGF